MRFLARRNPVSGQDISGRDTPGGNASGGHGSVGKSAPSFAGIPADKGFAVAGREATVGEAAFQRRPRHLLRMGRWRRVLGI